MTLLDNVPFAKLLGIEIESVEPGHAVLSMKIRNDLKQNHGVAHGGSVAAVIDSAMAIAIMPMLAENERTTTVDLTIQYRHHPAVGVLLEGEVELAKVPQRASYAQASE